MKTIQYGLTQELSLVCEHSNFDFFSIAVLTALQGVALVAAIPTLVPATGEQGLTAQVRELPRRDSLNTAIAGKNVIEARVSSHMTLQWSPQGRIMFLCGIVSDSRGGTIGDFCAYPQPRLYFPKAFSTAYTRWARATLVKSYWIASIIMSLAKLSTRGEHSELWL